MTHLSLTALEERVRALVADAPLNTSVSGVTASLPLETSDEDIVRITITIDQPGKLDRAEAARLTRRIEDHLIEADDRFPSVSFAEAA